MKYVLILVVVVILVRIDFVIRVIENTAAKIQRTTTPENTPAVGEVENSEIIPVGKDVVVNPTARKNFFGLLANYQSAPSLELKDKLLEILRMNPKLFDEKLDKDLEAGIYQLRDHLLQHNKETYGLLTDLMNILKGENLEMLKRFFSLLIDIDLNDFLSIYSKSRDVNCGIFTYLGDQLPDEEKYFELTDRLNTLDAWLAKDKTDPGQKLYAQRCQTALMMYIETIKPAAEAALQAEPPTVVDPDLAPVPAPEEANSTSVVPAPTVTPTPVPPTTTPQVPGTSP